MGGSGPTDNASTSKDNNNNDIYNINMYQFKNDTTGTFSVTFKCDEYFQISTYVVLKDSYGEDLTDSDYKNDFDALSVLPTNSSNCTFTLKYNASRLNGEPFSFKSYQMDDGEDTVTSNVITVYYDAVVLLGLYNVFPPTDNNPSDSVTLNYSKSTDNVYIKIINNNITSLTYVLFVNTTDTTMFNNVIKINDSTNASSFLLSSYGIFQGSASEIIATGNSGTLKANAENQFKISITKPSGLAGNYVCMLEMFETSYTTYTKDVGSAYGNQNRCYFTINFD